MEAIKGTCNNTLSASDYNKNKSLIGMQEVWQGNTAPERTPALNQLGS